MQGDLFWWRLVRDVMWAGRVDVFHMCPYIMITTKLSERSHTRNLELWPIKHQYCHPTGNLEQLFPNFNVIENHVGILLKRRFWFYRSGVGGGLRVCISNISQQQHSTRNLLEKQSSFPSADLLSQHLLKINKSPEINMHNIKVWEVLHYNNFFNPSCTL